MDAINATTFERANAMPAPTWHRLDINDCTIEIPAYASAPTAAVCIDAPELLIADAADAFDEALSQFQARHNETAQQQTAADNRAVLHAIGPTNDPHNLDVPALSLYETTAVCAELANNIVSAFEYGMGGAVGEFLKTHASRRTTLVARAGEPATATIHICGQDGCASMAHVDIIAEPQSELSLTAVLKADQGKADSSGGFDAPVVKNFDTPATENCDSPAAADTCDSPAADTCDSPAAEKLIALQMRVFAGAGAHVNITTVHIADESSIVLDNAGFTLDNDARIAVQHRTIGGGKAYVGLAADLRGDASCINVDTRYIAAHTEKRDFNYVVRHRGKKTKSSLVANGVLMGASKKTLRGTIDLVHGCKGSEGIENETVLLADEDVENKTVPVILCDEDDVAGNHGATIGHVRQSQLFYLMSRGLSRDAAEGLFASALLEETALNVPDAAVHAGLERIAEQLGIAFEHEEG